MKFMSLIRRQFLPSICPIVNEKIKMIQDKVRKLTKGQLMRATDKPGRIRHLSLIVRHYKEVRLGQED